MRKTKKLTLSALLVALGVTFMALGAFIDVLDLSVCALVSLIVVFVFIELGSPYTWLVWLCTSLISALLFPGSILWVEYLFVFGVYPILKAYIERAPRITWLPIKLGFINAVVWALFLVVELLFKLPVFEEGANLLWKIAIYILINVAFMVYDAFITVAVRLYFEKFRKRFKRFLK